MVLWLHVLGEVQKVFNIIDGNQIFHKSFLAKNKTINFESLLVTSSMIVRITNFIFKWLFSRIIRVTLKMMPSSKIQNIEILKPFQIWYFIIIYRISDHLIFFLIFTNF